MSSLPRFLPAGDRVMVAEFGDGIDEAVNARVHRVARALDGAAYPGIVETVPTYRSLAVHFDPRLVSAADVAAAVRDVDRSAAAALAPPARVVEIPVFYGGVHGPDLPDVAAHCGLSEAEVVTIHAAGDYRVFMMGFTPGFPYLGGLSPRIATPRLATPRTAVPGGSVGIAAQQTGVYPTTSPGGWRLIGWTPSELFNPASAPPALLDAGDAVRFVPVTDLPPRAGFAGSPPGFSGPETDSPAVEVLDGGLLTTVQDLGRFGFQRFGVPVSGAMDTWAIRAANRLVGNGDGAAALEITLVGPVLRFEADAVVAVCGAELSPELNGRPIRMERAVRVRGGDVLRFGDRRDGVRAVLAVAGGFAVPLVLGSRSTYLTSGFGGFHGRALRRGDRVPVGAVAPGGFVARRAPPSPFRARGASELVVRVMLGPQDDAFTDAGCETFLGSVFRVSTKSDRVGCRFEGPRVAHRAGADIVSDATAFGSVQVSGDGQPIVLMADRGTTGGYTKIATVIAADLPLVGQAAPGTAVRFRAIDAEDAADASVAREFWLDASAVAPAGWSDEIYDDDLGNELAADGMAALAAVLDAKARETRTDARGVRAGMAGLVVVVCVEAGATVAARETVAVVEAMKMQNPVRAPRAGRVARVCVAPGAQVSAGTVIVEYED
jgi:KipI family sensor histidine kinase inhibitor